VAGLRRPGPEREKKVVRAAEQDRPDVAGRRARWRAAPPALDPARLQFVDETRASTNLARRYGRAPVGERLVGAVPHGHWKATTFVAALGVAGLAAPMVIDGAMTGELFEAYGGQVLAPTRKPGDVVVWDNLACHKRARVRELIEAAGWEGLFLPPDSPDLSPIEPAFAKLKAMPRQAGKRTVDELGAFLGQALDAFGPQECRNYFRHCGYPATQTSKAH
jgi:transposase